MRSPPLVLSFPLDNFLALMCVPGRIVPCLHGCLMAIERAGDGALQARIEGPSRQQCFDQAARFLRPLVKSRPAFVIAAVLRTPPFGAHGRGGCDSWMISVNAGISFAPTAVAPTLAAAAHG